MELRPYWENDNLAKIMHKMLHIFDSLSLLEHKLNDCFLITTRSVQLRCVAMITHLINYVVLELLEFNPQMNLKPKTCQ